ncbi:GNAT family N-acetyltransferase [Pedobacter nototheniae]|uniref:GNAT family N-acetyltransferase n=1 Tax=Pedobacter nototheniae TaxID=2488994 RepID=UPI00292E8645|nr:GNAT family N-acetyltransferase [Pedobacter nototheniae]
MQNIIYRILAVDELHKIVEIDRAEDIQQSYLYENGALRLHPTPEVVKAFEPVEINNLIQKQIQIKVQGGEILGAFTNGILIGVSSIENKKRGSKLEYCKMDILYVSKGYRGKQIGHRLILEIRNIAKKMGAKKLYISATPTKATIDFYFKEGARIAKERDQELFLLEPLDIHLELDV